MTKIKNWCNLVGEEINGHSLQTLEADPAKVAVGIEAIAKVVPSH